MIDDLQKRVDRGAAWLDTVYPEWWTHIDLAKLDISRNCYCVIGQTFGSFNDFDDFSAASMSLLRAWMWPIRRGFFAFRRRHVERLNHLWTMQVMQRRVALLRDANRPVTAKVAP